MRRLYLPPSRVQLLKTNSTPYPMQTMTTPTQQPTTTRRRRLEAILETMNRLHCHRRVRGRAAGDDGGNLPANTASPFQP